MKKGFLTIAALFMTVAMFAFDALTIEGNKYNIKKAKGQVAVYNIDWTNTQCGDIDDGAFTNGSLPLMKWLQAQDEKKIAEGKPEDANYVKDWEAIKEEVNKLFKEEWNDEFGKKGLRITRNETEANLKLDIVIDGLYFGNIFGTLFGWGNAGGAIIMGHMDLTDKATGELVQRIKINHVQGSGHFTDRIRIWLVFNELIDEVEDLY